MRSKRVMADRGIANFLYSLAGVAGFVALWYAVEWLWHPPEFLFPTPSAVFQSTKDNAASLIYNSWITGYEVLLGFLLACVTGVGVAILIHLWPRLGKLLWPAVLFAQITPQIAFAPLLIMWFGIGLVSKIVIAALIAFFPILVNTYVGLQAIDEAAEDLARCMLAGRFRYLLEFELPNALPHILSGMKIAMTYAVVGAVVAEFISSNNGLGNMILVANGALDAASCISSVILLSLMGGALFGTVAVFERLLIPWHISQRRQTVRSSEAVGN